MDAYSTALTLLSRRELSARQLRERLIRRKFSANDIDAALDRLMQDRTVDDRRVAVASARMEAAIKGRGKRRVLQTVQRLGIAADIAKTAVDDVFDEVDEASLLDRALDKRLKGASLQDLDDKGRARVIRHLVAQGFEPSQVFARLRRKGVEADE
jgi:regulatory protein